ncbi:MAG: 1-acyl-sn-glycerol-3-phosphate acyltransferase, partial [Desulfomonilaceae bacterium]
MKHPFVEKTLPEFLKSGQFRGIPGVLNHKPSKLFKAVVDLLSPNIKFDDDAINLLRQIGADGPIMYALKYPSYYDLQYLRMRLASLGLPTPCFVLSGAGNFGNLISRAANLFRPASKARLTPEIIRNMLVNKCAGAFFLIDEHDSRNRYVSPKQDPINLLIEAQSKMSEPMAIVPAFVLYDRRQKRQVPPFWETLLGDPDRPGVIRRIITAFRKWTQPELLIGSPVNLIAEYEEFGSEKSWEDLPFEIRKELIENINDRIRVNRGPEKLSRLEIEERVLQDARVQKAVSELAKSEKTTEENARKKAQAYVNEIAADQRIQMIHFLYYALNWLFKRILDKIDFLDSDFVTLKKANEKNSLIFVSCHKSHLDYLVVGYILFTNQMPLPLMAAGKNLSFWPVGHILRRGGAFFIRRSFKGLRLYTRVFASYVQVLVKERVNINFYIEGGRSRTGKFLHPKVGMLGFLLDPVFEGAVEDLTFVPTFAGYDRVPEEKSYLQELRGREKQKESFFSFLESRKILKTKFGAAYVRFHQPVSFKDFATRIGVESHLTELAPAERRVLVENFAFYLMTRIGSISIITLPDLVAAALVSNASSVVETSSFEQSVDVLSKGLYYLGIEISGNPKDLLNNCRKPLEGFTSRKFLVIEKNPEEQPQRYLINESRRSNLEFYKNS